MEENIRIFTTPILDDVKILEYKEPVIVRNVRAMSIIHDMMTRVRDVVGGRSGSYQDLMKKMEEEVIEELKEKARAMGASQRVTFVCCGVNVNHTANNIKKTMSASR